MAHECLDSVLLVQAKSGVVAGLSEPLPASDQCCRPDESDARGIVIQTLYKIAAL
jgi:hypothetical protein